jgi:hypothetical protein
MSEEITINYLVYDNEVDAIARAETEGIRRNYSYYKVGRGTRYTTYPQVTADDKYALVVDGYELTEDEESSIVTNVTFPNLEEV